MPGGSTGCAAGIPPTRPRSPSPWGLRATDRADAPLSWTAWSISININISKGRRHTGCRAFGRDSAAGRRRAATCGRSDCTYRQPLRRTSSSPCGMEDTRWWRWASSPSCWASPQRDGSFATNQDGEQNTPDWNTASQTRQVESWR